MTGRIERGSRVCLSDLALRMRIEANARKKITVGTVSFVNPSTGLVAVVWDNRKSVERYHMSFLAPLQ